MSHRSAALRGAVLAAAVAGAGCQLLLNPDNFPRPETTVDSGQVDAGCPPVCRGQPCFLDDGCGAPCLPGSGCLPARHSVSQFRLSYVSTEPALPADGGDFDGGAEDAGLIIDDGGLRDAGPGPHTIQLFGYSGYELSMPDGPNAGGSIYVIHKLAATQLSPP